MQHASYTKKIILSINIVLVISRLTFMGEFDIMLEILLNVHQITNVVRKYRYL